MHAAALISCSYYTQHLNTQRKEQLFSSVFWRKIATYTQGWRVQLAIHTLGKVFHTPDSEGGADS